MSWGFSIEKYKKSENHQNTETGMPNWVDTSKPKIVALVQAIDDEFRRIQQLIAGSTSKITISERQVKSIAVCKIAKVAPSYIRTDRKDTRLVHEYLADKNSILNELWSKSKNLHNNSGRKLLKSDLIEKNKKLKNQLREMQEGKDRAYFEQWVEQNIISDQKRLHALITDLKAKILELEKEKAALKLDLDEVRKRTLLPFKN